MALLDGPEGTQGTEGNQGTGDNQFLTSLPEDLRGESSLSSFKDVGSLAKSYIETKKMVGNAALLKPPAGDDPALKADWIKNMRPKLAEMGLMELPPESADKYQYQLKDYQGNEITAETIASDPSMKEFNALAHSVGLSNKQAQKLIEGFATKIMPSMMPQTPDQVTTEKVLQAEFGKQYDQKMSVARKAVNVLNTKVAGFKDWLEDPNHGHLGNDPVYIKIMAQIGEMLSQDFGGGEGEKVNNGESLDSISSKMKAIQTDPNLRGDEMWAKLKPLAEQKANIIKNIKLKG